MNSWYRFEKDNPIGIPRIKEYLVGFYDEQTGKCYDEARYKPDEVAKVMPYLMVPFVKVFTIFSKDEIYELTLSLTSFRRG